MNRIILSVIVFLYLNLCFCDTILFDPRWVLSYFAKEEQTYGEEMFKNKLDIQGITPLSGHEFYMNIKEINDLCNIYNSYCINMDVKQILNYYYNKEELMYFLHNMNFDNSYYIQRLNYYEIGATSKEEILDRTIEKINSAETFERVILIKRLSQMFWEGSQESKEKIFHFVCNLWENTPYLNDTYPLIIVYNDIKNDFNRDNDKRMNKFGEPFVRNGRERLNMPSFHKISNGFYTKPCLPTRNLYKPNKMFDYYFTYSAKYTGDIKDKSNPWHINAYNELIALEHFLDADFLFYFFRRCSEEELIDLARKHIQNPEFKDARYKTVYYLLNHDFDYSFPILIKMVEDGSLHINEKKNFYRGLARLNKVSHSVLTKEQQQQANDYLLSQIHSEQDIATKLYIDFLLSICVDEYGLSDGRTVFLNSLKETDTISQEDIAQIDRRLKIIKYSIYMHSPSIFDSYVNGLKTEKPFVDVTKVDIHRLPVYEAEANGETWYYHDVNSEAYIAYNTNKYFSYNLTIPSTLDNYPVVGIIDEAFVDFQGCITNIIIPNSVRTIATHAFAHNTNLCSIAIPNSVTKIGQDVFKKSTNLKKIYLEEGSPLTDECFYDSYHVNLHPNCKIIRTKFENGLPVIPLDEKNNE